MSTPTNETRTLRWWMQNHQDRDAAIWVIPSRPSAGVASIATHESIFTPAALNAVVFWAYNAICATLPDGVVTFMQLNQNDDGEIVDANGEIQE